MKDKKQHIICPDNNELSQFLEGTLSDERDNFILQHLDKCEDCMEAVRLALEFDVFRKAKDKKDDTSNYLSKKAGLGLLAGGAAMGRFVENILGRVHNIPKVAGKKSETDERFSDEGDSNEIDNHKNEINMENNLGFQEADKTHGADAQNSQSEFVQQNYMDTCAIKSQQLILNDFGIPVSENQLVEDAMNYGWYAPGQGTSINDVGNLLEVYGVETKQIENANIFNLTNELAKGHRVIVGVDSGELWNNGFYENLEDSVMGDIPDHALIVSGIDTSDPESIKVIITDPGTGDYCREYPMEQFVDAWEDSNCFLVSTVEPAPYEFNQESMSHFDYELGHISNIGQLPYDDFENSLNEIPELVDGSLNESDSLALGDSLKSAVLGKIPGYNLVVSLKEAFVKEENTLINEEEIPSDASHVSEEAGIDLTDNFSGTDGMYGEENDEDEEDDE